MALPWSRVAVSGLAAVFFTSACSRAAPPGPPAHTIPADARRGSSAARTPEGSRFLYLLMFIIRALWFDIQVYVLDSGLVPEILYPVLPAVDLFLVAQLFPQVFDVELLELLLDRRHAALDLHA